MMGTATDLKIIIMLLTVNELISFAQVNNCNVAILVLFSFYRDADCAYITNTLIIIDEDRLFCWGNL